LRGRFFENFTLIDHAAALRPGGTPHSGSHRLRDGQAKASKTQQALTVLQCSRENTHHSSVRKPLEGQGESSAENNNMQPAEKNLMHTDLGGDRKPLHAWLHSLRLLHNKTHEPRLLRPCKKGGAFKLPRVSLLPSDK
jgi:hypothetical protein